MSNALALNVQIDRKSYVQPDGTAGRTAIKGLTFVVPPRQFVCIVGPSGCGKTTLLNIIARLDRSVEGSITCDNGVSIDEVKMGYMFQTPRLLPWLSVRDNVRIVMDEKSVTDGRSEARRRAEALLEKMELGDALDDFPNRLSGGMQRRVALARSFVTQPALLLLDEPFVSLDAPVGNRLRQLLLELWRDSQTTVIFVTHDLHEAIFLADRILFLSRGPSRIILDEPVSLARPRQIDDTAIARFQKNLLGRHESLLRGLTDDQKNTPLATQDRTQKT